jgi:hypothetical protein
MGGPIIWGCAVEKATGGGNRTRDSLMYRAFAALRSKATLLSASHKQKLLPSVPRTDLIWPIVERNAIYRVFR